MFKPGGIVKISVTNFVTYTYAELYPGPNLNTIVGANGSGKSTMVAAIILGLGGTPKTIGRGHKISEYIKHNCDNSTILIELQGDNKRTFTISREFNKTDNSVWKLNGTKKTTKEIMEYIARYKIQVNNLCQFLPQDRVADFAKLNKQELLKQTQIALCRHDLILKQEHLIEKRERHRYLSDNLNKMCTKLEQFKEANMRLEGKIKSLEKKKECLSKIEHISRKQMWIKYTMLFERREGFKKTKDDALEVFQRHSKASKPMEEIIQKAKQSIRNLDIKYRLSQSELTKLQTALVNDADCLHSCKEELKDIMTEKQEKINELEQKVNEISTAERKLDLLVYDKTQIIEKFGQDGEINEKLQALNNDARKLGTTVGKFEEDKISLNATKRENEYNIRPLQAQLQRLENVKQQRLELLRRTDKGAHAGTLWLRENRHLFQGDVFEPVMLEINVINQKHAMYVERTIAFRDKIAFLCTEKADMNLLIRHLNVQQKLGVNIIYAEARSNSAQFQPKYPIERLRKCGFQAYLSSLLSAPEPIMNYLRKNYKIHNIPVSFEDNNIPNSTIPREITVFFKGNCRYAISYSRYTGEMTTKQLEIKSDNSLSLSVDQVQIENVKAEISEIKRYCESFNGKLRAIDENITEATKKKDRIRENMQALKNTKQQMENIDARIRVMKNKITDMMNDQGSKESIENAYEQKCNDVIIKLTTKLESREVAYNKLMQKNVEHHLNETNYNTSRKQVALLENKFEDLANLVREAEANLNRAKEDFIEITREVKIALQKAKDLSSGFSPEDRGFDKFREEYNKLPNETEELDAEKDLLNSKVDCLVNAADQSEIEEYEERARNIEKMQDDVLSGDSELEDITNNMDLLMREWCEPLNELIGEIHKRFSESFEMMGCAGEISLSTGEEEKDFEKYGLCVKVTYRNGEPLQELNNVVQSGGERAVATAVFMLSLQELTPVPFRCVDEINQGMDANNERRVFELLVDTTNKPDTSQYFLITPKLIPNLKFVPSMKIHFVHNGPFVCNQLDWNRAQQNNVAV